MKRILALVVIVCSALLSSCDSVSIGIIGGSDGPTSVIVAENEEQTSNLNDIDKYFKDNYVDKQKLPILDINIENPVVSDDRILVLDDTIENNLELLIYEYYKNLMSGSFEDVKEIIADGSLLASNDAYENNFKEGIYYSKIEIDEIELIDKDDLDEIAIKNKQAIVKKINDLKMTEFAIVEVDKTITHNEKALSMVPQVGNGDVTRYFVLGKKDDKYKIVEVYWEGFMSDQ
ncbi:MAG: sodium ion-translocating decarboxylase subunit beta [Ruminococcaceae bacterium]|nr:sodium ion-translocating decarboxylase subunit beta [Oscillospiraceae bacterium]